jgi:NAD(P)-dependent dehydrogenase (short-subunit alcohol dehydrogenase family)
MRTGTTASASHSAVPTNSWIPTPDEIAAMVVFLISAQALNISGQHRRVDGGYVYLDRALT